MKNVDFSGFEPGFGGQKFWVLGGDITFELRFVVATRKWTESYLCGLAVRIMVVFQNEPTNDEAGQLYSDSISCLRWVCIIKRTVPH